MREQKERYRKTAGYLQETNQCVVSEYKKQKDKGRGEAEGDKGLSKERLPCHIIVNSVGGKEQNSICIHIIPPQRQRT